MKPSPVRHFSCCACSVCATGLRRRGFLGLFAATAAAASLGGLRAEAADPGASYEAMLLSCIDPRMVEPVYNYMAGRGLTGKYSQVVLAGAAVAVVAPTFESWEPAFWGNLAATVELHHIRRVIAIDHRNCGAARIAYGEAAVATPDAETATHRRAMAVFRQEVAKRHPKLEVETLLMALDGKTEVMT
jgi:carbonic anhydrase